MVENISILRTTSSPISITGLKPSQNIQQKKPETQFTLEAVKLTISPEARRLLKENPTSQGKSTIDPEAQNRAQSIETSNSESNPDSVSEMSPEDERQLQKLKQTDITVKNHERQHAAVAAGYVKNGPVYEYTIGPDNKRYAIAGHVSMDMSQVPNNPEATIRKAQVIKRAALAPADPSGADRAVASAAVKMELKASKELQSEQTENLKTVNQKGQNSKVNAYSQSLPKLGGAVNLLL